MEKKELLQQLEASQEIHSNFLTATEKNLSYFYWGKDQDILDFTKSTLTYGDFVNNLESVKPASFNSCLVPLQVMFQEIGNTNVGVQVAVKGALDKIEGSREIVNQLEDKLSNLFSDFDSQGLVALFEMVNHSYEVFYLDALKGEFYALPLSDFVPGDPQIANIEDQPFVKRFTYPRKIDLVKSLMKADESKVDKKTLDLLKEIPDFSTLTVSEIWSKTLDKRILMLSSGNILYEDEMPEPKEYPFFKASESLDPNRWYTMPLMSKARPLLEKYKKLTESIDHACRAIARPMLVYDKEASINIDKLRTQLQEGDKNLLVGKSEVGDINFKSPGQLPEYLFVHQRNILETIYQLLGVSSAAKVGSVRERGAVEAMYRASLRQFVFYANRVRVALQKMCDYYLEYIRTHRLQFLDEFKDLSTFKDIGFKSTIELLPSSASRTLSEQAFTLRKVSEGIISKNQGIKELGYANGDMLRKEIKSEVIDQRDLAKDLEKPPTGLKQRIEEIIFPLFDYQPEVLVSGESKAIVKVKENDKEKVRFLLSDLDDVKVYIETVKEVTKAVPVEKQVEEKPQEEPEQEESSSEEETQEEERSEKPSVTPVKSARPDKTKEEVQKEIAKANKPQSTEDIKKVVETPKETNKKSALNNIKNVIEKLAKNSRTKIKASAVSKFINQYPGLYLAGSHSKDINVGKKLMMVKSKLFDIVDKPHILLGPKYAYGIIIPRLVFKLDRKRFDITQKYHLVTEEERKKWWGNKPLYGYLFEYHKFEEPVEWKRKPGVKTFVKAPIPLRVEKEGVPYTGDLKPVSLKPYDIPPVAKPEKKAFQPYEIFSKDRIKECIPKGNYNISEKVDGIRCFCWKNNDEVRFYTSEGNLIPKERVNSLEESVKKLFKSQDVLLDGELVLEGKIHQHVTGFVHSNKKPTLEEIKALKFVFWDILYLNGKTIANKPFIDRYRLLNLKIKPGQTKGKVRRAKATNASRETVASAVKRVTSPEGVVIRDIDAAYWATHSLYKMKKTTDIDVKVIAVEKTKTDLPIFHCALRDNTYIGKTYAQADVNAKPGDVIRVLVDHFSLKPDGSIGWFSPKPKNVKGDIKKHPSVTQDKIGGADTIAFVKESYLSHGGLEDKWDAWYGKHKQWKKDKNKEIINKLKNK